MSTFGVGLYKNIYKMNMTGKLADNIVHFGRVLRKAGVAVGPGAVISALEAVACGGVRKRDDFYWALHCALVKSHRDSALFDQAFHVFWRKPKMLEQMMQMFFSQIALSPDVARPKQAGFRRLAESMFDKANAQNKREEPPGVIELDADFTASDKEVLKAKDFEQMSTAEQIEAKAAIARMRLARVEVPTRRFSPARRGSVIDLRRTLRASLRAGGDMIDLNFRKNRYREPPLVVLLDISGSMTNYSRMLLHFLHSLCCERDRVQVFVFGTRLTNITRELNSRDVDEALTGVSGAVEDWSGGTRIGECLKEFNFKWARRVLGQGAHVLLMSDGLERDESGLLEREMSRLKRAARRIVWLNPLLRFDGFEARAQGVRTIMGNVDEFRPVHSLDSLLDLANCLAGSKNEAHNPRNWLDAS